MVAMKAKKGSAIALTLALAVGGLHAFTTGAWTQGKNAETSGAAAKGAAAKTTPETKTTPKSKAIPKTLPSDRSDAMRKLDEITRQALAGDYAAARWHPIHFKPAIDASKQADCLTCHQEILSDKPRETSQAGQKADDLLAWYQTLETYTGKQESFHWRHLQSPLAKQVMNLDCKFCHQGNDPREQSPHVTVSTKDMTANNGKVPFTLRKRVNPEETCLKCHGSFPWKNMEGLTGPWHEMRADLEPEGVQNGCMACHAAIRTEKHKVTYLKAAGIDKAGETSSDTCYGCHGGRAWYRTSYPYPRTPWPDMPTDVPDWAKNRPTKSDPRYAITGK
jgi:hypothetical protein